MTPTPVRLPDARENLRCAYGAVGALLLFGLVFEWCLIGALS